MFAVMTGTSTDKTTPVLTSEMEFTDEELMWLLDISSEVPDGDLTPMEEFWCELAKPTTSQEARLFQLLATIHFGLIDSSTMFHNAPQ
ncbi:hypothetical protein Q7C36_010416 [Tachysurus vachellii]|uniref:Uncharacterized protein n=1 Tax=Tachysurus vachellii TaxID=175792 RepID=A0AA88MUP1_TACVA|nr:hypothetical protein Q7C36_010416 [Tachysurus vachellii]